MSKIFIVMGKSATGKDTIYKKLLESDEIKLKTAVMYTTRPIRAGEQDGVEYFFVEEAALQLLKEQNKIIEHRSYQTVQGEWHYFTVNDGQIDLEHSSYLMIGTLETFEQIREYFGKDKVWPIYIEVEDGLRLMRAINREKEQSLPQYSEMCRRFLADEEDFSEENLARIGINKRYQNNNMDDCINQIVSDVKKLL